MTSLVQILTSLQPFDQAEIVRIDEPHTDYLAGFGLYPGVSILLRQTFPSYVIQTEETELALESEVARKIHVRWLASVAPAGGGRQRRRQRERLGKTAASV